MHNINDIAKSLSDCTGDRLSKKCDTCLYRNDNRRCSCIAALHKDALSWIAQNLHVITLDTNESINREENRRDESLRFKASFSREVKPVSQKQLNFIKDIRKKSLRQLPPFIGTTMEEASEWITRYRDT